MALPLLQETAETSIKDVYAEPGNRATVYDSFDDVTNFQNAFTQLSYKCTHAVVSICHPNGVQGSNAAIHPRFEHKVNWQNVRKAQICLVFKPSSIFNRSPKSCLYVEDENADVTIRSFMTKIHVKFLVLKWSRMDISKVGNPHVHWLSQEGNHWDVFNVS